MSEYQPASCNIGRPQRRHRYRNALAAFGVAGAYLLAIAVDVLPAALLVGVFVPLAFGFEWAIQAYTAFCVRLALLGRYDFRRGDTGDAGTVPDPAARRADHVYAARITAVGALAAAVTTAVAVLLF